MTAYNELTLNVYDCRCVCGNQWTHSYVTYRLGGTPGPVEEAHNPLTKLYTGPTRHQSHCYRCVNLALGIGWTKPLTPLQELAAKLGANGE